MVEPIEADRAEGQDDPGPESGPHRRCIVTGEVQAKESMLRFVVSPDGLVVPDVENRLPGRGMWCSARRDVVDTAARKNLFSKAARAKVQVPPDLGDRVEGLLRRRCLDLIGMARRAGHLVAGFEKVTAELRAGRGAILLEAADAAAGGRGKVEPLAAGRPVVDLFNSAELGAALGRDAAVHVLVAPGGVATRMKSECERLARYCGRAPHEGRE